MRSTRWAWILPLASVALALALTGGGQLTGPGTALFYLLYLPTAQMAVYGVGFLGAASGAAIPSVVPVLVTGLAQGAIAVCVWAVLRVVTDRPSDEAVGAPVRS